MTVLDFCPSVKLQEQCCLLWVFYTRSGCGEQCNEKRSLHPCSYSNTHHLPVRTGWCHKNMILYWDNLKRSNVSLPWLNYQLRQSIIVITPGKECLCVKKILVTNKEKKISGMAREQIQKSAGKMLFCMDDTWQKCDWLQQDCSVH